MLTAKIFVQENKECSIQASVLLCALPILIDVLGASWAFSALSLVYCIGPIPGHS
jgi:hypothetical protein